MPLPPKTQNFIWTEKQRKQDIKAQITWIMENLRFIIIFNKTAITRTCTTCDNMKLGKAHWVNSDSQNYYQMEKQEKQIMN